MKSIKYIVVMLIMSFVSYIAEGKRINRDVAYSYAQQFTCANTVISRSGSGLEFACSNNNYYVFNYTNGGFVIVSGSDRTESILGYSDSGKSK